MKGGAAVAAAATVKCVGDGSTTSHKQTDYSCSSRSLTLFSLSLFLWSGWKKLWNEMGETVAIAATATATKALINQDAI